jgi:hypothetical protein
MVRRMASRLRMMAPRVVLVWLGAALAPLSMGKEEVYRPVPLQARVTKPQPMTGIALWSSNPATATAPVQLEFAYLRYDQVVTGRGRYDWAAVDNLLEQVAGRKHQAILRWHDTYVGRPTGVPAYIKELDDYRETHGLSENQPTSFPDWSHPEWQSFVLEFFERFAARYDRDPRIAFVQVGFGLWAEYHIYDGPMELGRTFPSMDFQARFARLLGERLRETPWMISVDAAAPQRAPFVSDPELLGLPFGVFDDSFNHARHATVNAPNWKALGNARWKIAPAGGEFSFYEPRDQREALALRGPHGVPFEEQAAKFHLTFIIGDGQPRYQSSERIREAGLACGYRFRVTRFEASDRFSVVTVENRGIAPIYHHAHPAVNGVRADESLKGLLPGESRSFRIASGGVDPELTIESDRLAPGQRIEFEADLR